MRHIERTKILFHFISAESKDPIGDYKTIRKELAKHNKNLLDKKEYVFLSKSDTANKKELERKIKEMKQTAGEVLPISIIDDETIRPVEKIFNELIEQKHKNI